VPSLEAICVDRILNKKNYETILSLYSIATHLLRPEWKILCRQYISERYLLYVDKFGEQALEEALDPDDYARMKQSHEARLLAERRFSHKVSISNCSSLLTLFRGVFVSHKSFKSTNQKMDIIPWKHWSLGWRGLRMLIQPEESNTFRQPNSFRSLR
jgi:hypothetical protein